MVLEQDYLVVVTDSKGNVFYSGKEMHVLRKGLNGFKEGEFFNHYIIRVIEGKSEIKKSKWTLYNLDDIRRPEFSVSGFEFVSGEKLEKSVKEVILKWMN